MAKGKNQSGSAASDEDSFDDFPVESGAGGGMGKKIFKYGVPFNVFMAALIAYTQMSKKPAAAIVTDLTESSFDTFVNKHPEGVLVDFQMPGCVHCDQLAPEFEKAAKVLKDRKPGSDGEGGGPIMLASVDGDAQTVLAKKYEIKRYPTVLFFKEGENVQELPPMSRTSEKITEFVNWVAGPAVVEFPSRKDFDEAVPQLRASMHEKSPPVLVGFAGQGREQLRKNLEHIGERYRGKAIYLWVQEGEGSTDGDATAVALRSYAPAAEGDSEFTGSVSELDAVREWVDGLLSVHKETVKAASAKTEEKTEEA